MIRNYLKVALRNLGKEKAYTFINVFGLAIGVACVLLIALFIRHEWSFDRFHEASDRIFRAWGREDYGEGREFFYTVTPIVLGPTLHEAIPEVEEVVRVRALSALVGREVPPGGSDPERLTESIRMVEESFFDVFSFDLLEGDPAQALAHPNSVVLTREIARKYFGDELAVGKTLLLDLAGTSEPFQVTGVTADPPVESSIRFGMLIPFSKALDLFSEGAQTSWFNVSVETYVLLAEGTSHEAVQEKIPALLRRTLGDVVDEAGYRIGLQPLTDIHLNTNYPAGIEPISNPVYSYMLGAVGVLLLIVACINFVTLSIGRSVRRAAEVGVRKAMGAARGDVMRQFWGEALVVVSLGVLLGAALARMGLPTFSTLADRQIEASFEPVVVLSLIALTLVIALIAGIYPALVLSGHSPGDILRGRMGISADRSLLRRGLVVVQFSISILMLTATLFVIQQLSFVKNKDLGYAKDHVVVVRTGVGSERAALILDRMRSEFQGDARIVSAGASAFAMTDRWADVGFEDNSGRFIEVVANVVSPEFLETLQIEMLAGRSFEVGRPADSTALVVNEAFVRQIGFASPEDALGRSLPSAGFAPHEIIGVVADFNFETLHTAVRPLVMALTSGWLFEGASDVSVSSSPAPDISLRIASEDLSGAVARIEAAWKTAAVDLPFEFYFLDSALDSRYRDEERLESIVTLAAAITVVIACLGVFGLAALSVVRRRKEVGIRKVLGASVSSIIMLFSRDFAVLVGIAFVIAVPIAYVLVVNWLGDFAYRISLTPWTFLAAGLIAAAGALLTVGYQSARAASADPVVSLRYE